MLVLERGPLRLITLRPFAITVRRAGRRLMRSGGLWVADGTIHDHFVQFTEGVIAREELAPPERALRGEVREHGSIAVELAVRLEGGRQARLRLGLPGDDRHSLELDADGEPFVAQWWMGTGSPLDLTSPAAEEWWRAQAKRVLKLGVEGIKADDGEGYYLPDHARLADGRAGASAAWALGGLHRLSLQRALRPGVNRL